MFCRCCWRPVSHTRKIRSLHFTFMHLLQFTFTAIVSPNVYAHCKVRPSLAFGPRVDFEFILIEVLTHTVASPASPDQFDQEAWLSGKPATVPRMKEGFSQAPVRTWSPRLASTKVLAPLPCLAAPDVTNYQSTNAKGDQVQKWRINQQSFLQLCKTLPIVEYFT